MMIDIQIPTDLIAEVGWFKYWRNGAGEDSVEGPGDYMNGQGETLLTQLATGEDAIFNLTCGQSASLEIAVLVRLQNDYASWRGIQQFCAQHGID